MKHNNVVSCWIPISSNVDSALISSVKTIKSKNNYLLRTLIPDNVRISTVNNYKSSFMAGFGIRLHRRRGMLQVGVSCVAGFWPTTGYRILGSNSIYSFARSFTHRRRKTRCIFLLRLAGFISTIQNIYLVTCVAKSSCERHCFIHCSIHGLFAVHHESIASGLYSHSRTRDPAWYLRPGISYLIVSVLNW